MNLHSTKQNFKSDRFPVLLNGTKYWIYRRYGRGAYMLSDSTRMTIKILKSAGFVGEIPMTKKYKPEDPMPEMVIDKPLAQLYQINSHLMHLI